MTSCECVYVCVCVLVLVRLDVYDLRKEGED